MFKRRGFTLIELLVTVSIIVLMALIGIPTFSKYGDEMAYKQKAVEIKALIEELNVLSNNPEKGIIQYRIRIPDTSTISLEKSSNGSNFFTVKDIKALDSEIISFINSYNSIICNTSRVCWAIATGTPGNNYLTTSTELIKLEDNNISPPKIAIFSLKASPFILTVTGAE
ncbi:MAG: type II secretion system protein [Bacteroidota bacterium]|nr:type II secretion system protein [Bacteroidota bacterium]